MSNVIVGGNLIAAITGGVFYTTPLARTTEGSDVLETSPSSVLAYYIIETLAKMTDPSEGDTWPLYISSMPDGDDIETNCGALYDTSGIQSMRQMNGYIAQFFGIQLRIRSKTYEIGWAKIEDIGNALDEVNNISVEITPEEYEIQNISRTTPIVPLGLERGTKRRYLFTLNFAMTIKKLT